MSATLDVVSAPRCYHGEGPVWDPRIEQLLWVDLMAGEIHSFAWETGAFHTRAVGREVGVAVPRRGEGLALVVREGFALLDADDAETLLASPLADQPALRMNDGACDPAGRLWAGSMAYDARAGAGSLYRVDTDGALATVLEDVTISNGLGWDPDERWLYYIDSASGGVDRFAYDRETAAIRERRRIVDVPKDLGEPDGLAIDADGCLWIAVWDGGQIRRHAPDGRLLATVDVPVRRPTSCAFGGPGLDRLFITSSQFGLDAAARARQPLAGALFVADVGVTGLPTSPFGA